MTVHPPVFPGGHGTAPETTAGGCAYPACLCPVAPGERFCCMACVRSREDEESCRCGHAGCTERT